MKMRFKLKDVLPWAIGAAGLGLVLASKSKTLGTDVDAPPNGGTKPPPTGPGIPGPDVTYVPGIPGAAAKVGDTVEVKNQLVTRNAPVSEGPFKSLPSNTTLQVLVTKIIPEMWQQNTFGVGLEGVVTGYLDNKGITLTPKVVPLTGPPDARFFRKDVLRTIAVPVAPPLPIDSVPPWLRNI
jgi:hypothetical protein